MLLHSRLLTESVQLSPANQVLFLNSAAEPFVVQAAQHLNPGSITLAEDNIASLHTAIREAERNMLPPDKLRHVAFDEYFLHEPAATMDRAIMNLLYQPGNAWMLYGLQVAAYALKPGGRLYVVGAKDRGVLSMARRMQEYFGNVETLTISKGCRVVSSGRGEKVNAGTFEPVNPAVFADGKLDEGTRLLLEALEVHPMDEALDIGCGVGFIGLYIARLACGGNVTMVDASLAAVAVARHKVEESGLTNVKVQPSDGAQAVLQQRFDLVATNPPFHLGGIQTTEVAERFVREAAQVLKPPGRFYLVANRFLKYEPALRANFKQVDEVIGNARYKVLRASGR
jgi:16S rRNA (guanine1207-N2)-methyltransferase